MADNKDANIVDEVEKRLEDLFGDDDDSDFEIESSDDEESLELEKDVTVVDDTPVLEEDMGDEDVNPLTELKSLVLSIEWEITDDIMTKFLTQLNQLMGTYKDDRIVLMFLQLLSSVGKYIKAKKANADPDVVKLLNTAYAGMEQVVLTKNISETDRKKVLASEVNKFKIIKERLIGKLAKKKTDAEAQVSEAKAVKAVSPLAPETEDLKAQVSRGKVFGVGSRFAFMVFLPLVVIALVVYLYSCRITGIPSQIDQMLQMVFGMTVQASQHVVLGVLSVLLILIGLSAFLYGSRLAGRIKDLTRVVERLSAGDRDASIEVKTDDEVGALSEAIGRLQDTLR